MTRPLPDMTAAQRVLGALWLWLVAMACIGVITVLSIPNLPLETLEEAGVTVPVAIAASLISNGLLIGIAVILGALTAHRVGLTSLIAHKVDGPARKMAAWPVYAVLGIAFGLATALLDAELFERVPAMAALAAQSPSLAGAGEVDAVNLTTRFLYGGVVEEILVRWSLVGLLGWALAAIFRSRHVGVGLAILLAAFVFGVGHLPAVYALVPNPPTEFIVRTVALNMLIGVPAGIAFARNSLEAAMVLHAAAHVGLLAVSQGYVSL